MYLIQIKILLQIALNFGHLWVILLVIMRKQESKDYPELMHQKHAYINLAT